MIIAACNTVDEAKSYISRMGLTRDDCKIYKGKDYVNVIANDPRQWKQRQPKLSDPNDLLLNMMINSGYSREFVQFLYPKYNMEGDKV